jgi:DNA-directed RNA polymerase subunit RPC12/RpoP
MATVVVCPSCGHQFDRPFFTEKRSGLGFTFGALGDIKCPACGFKGHWGQFKKFSDLPPGSEILQKKKTPPPPSPEEEKEKTLDDTKYEQP